MTPSAGLGFRMQHLSEALASQRPGLWFEVHAENYMMDGGPRLAALDQLRDRHPIAIHGVGLSLASVDPIDDDHLARLARLVDRIDPFLVSDHLAWQRWDGVHYADFLPFPRTRDALSVVGANVQRVQDVLGRRILVENPSHYAPLDGHEMSEAEFLSLLSARTGCGLILDVNNVHVSAHNLAFDANSAINAFPSDAIAEIHLAGHAVNGDPSVPLLIDTHDAPVCDPVWALFDRLIERIGPRPTLIERDDAIPAFDLLMQERDRADRRLRSVMLDQAA